MSEMQYSCDLCNKSLPASGFSKSQINKLEHNKITSVRCIACTEGILANTEKERLEKIKQDKKELKRKKKALSADPSSLYIKQPLKCPIVLDATNFFQSKNINFKVNIGKTKEWRTVAKIAVRGVLNADKTSIQTVFGLFKPGTHEVIDCTESPAHHPNINKVINILKKVCIASKVNGYVEGTGSDKKDNYEFKTYLKYIILAVERKTNKIQLSLVWNTEPQGSNKDGDYFLRTLVANLLKESSQPEAITATTTTSTSNAVTTTTSADSTEPNPLFHSIVVNYNPASRYSNCITGRGDDCWSLLYGEECILETVTTDTSITPPPQLRFPPYVFRQANITAFTKIIQNLRNWIPRVADGNDNDTSAAAAANGERCVVTRGNGVVETGVFSVSPVPTIGTLKDKPSSLASTTASTTARATATATSTNDESTYSYSANNLKDGISCVELYGGVGTIGLNTLDLVSKINCSDENPHNKTCFEATLSEIVANNPSLRGKATYTSLNAGTVASQGGLKGYDLVIVDPPRKGLDDDVIDALLDDYSVLDVIEPVKLNLNLGLNVGGAPGSMGVMGEVKKNKRIVFGDDDDDAGDAKASGSSTATARADKTATTNGAAKNGGGNHANPPYNKRLIYVSCGFKAFKRDCARLLGETTSADCSVGAGTGAGAVRESGLDYDEDEYLLDASAVRKRAKLSHNNEYSGTAWESAATYGASTTALPGAAGTGSGLGGGSNKAARKQRFWKLVHAEGHVLFPGSDHIETFAVFDRIVD